MRQRGHSTNGELALTDQIIKWEREYSRIRSILYYLRKREIIEAATMNPEAFIKAANSGNPQTLRNFLKLYDLDAYTTKELKELTGLDTNDRYVLVKEFVRRESDRRYCDGSDGTENQNL